MQVAPQLSVRRGRAAVDFYIAAFGAVEQHRVGGTNEHEEVVSLLSVGEGTFWVADEAPEHGNHSPESLGGATTHAADRRRPGRRDRPRRRARRARGGARGGRAR